MEIIKRRRKIQMRSRSLVFSITFLLAICLVTSCKKSHWQGSIEVVDGVSVIKNPMFPANKDKSPLKFEESFIIDFERDDLVNVGITEVLNFDVDSQGNIYILVTRTSENWIYKFNSSGTYISAFGRQGQGPGEIKNPYMLRINNKNEILVSERTRSRLIIYNSMGDLIKEIPLAPNHEMATLLENGLIFAMEANFYPDEGVTQMPIVLCSPKLKTLTMLHPGYKIPNWVRAKKINGLRTNINWFPWSLSDKNIYIGNEDNGYELLVYDLTGTLMKKIQKEYTPVPVPESVKKDVLDDILRPELEQFKIKDKIYFPKNMYPFQYFVADDKGMLYVMTYEKGENPGEYLFDIFDSNGIFAGRTRLDNSGNETTAKWGGPFQVKVKNDLIYSLRKKESGYQELIVYKFLKN
jgi:hypothetical protein